jgi:hypothetical protein
VETCLFFEFFPRWISFKVNVSVSLPVSGQKNCEIRSVKLTNAMIHNAENFHFEFDVTLLVLVVNVSNQHSYGIQHKRKLF